MPYPSITEQADRARANVAQLGLQTLTGTLTLTLPTHNCSLLQLDPGGAARTVLLWPELDMKGAVVDIVNYADAAETITVKEDSNTTTIASIPQNRAAKLMCDGTTWTLVCVSIITLT